MALSKTSMFIGQPRKGEDNCILKINFIGKAKHPKIK
jgi:hypothetical protein